MGGFKPIKKLVGNMEKIHIPKEKVRASSLLDELKD